jgi:protein TonB
LPFWKEKYINDKIKKGKYWDLEGKRISASDLIIKPEYSGGMDAFRHMVAENLVYPSLAEENGIHGKVYVEFVISKNGERTKPKIIRSVDPLLDQEALRVINLSDKWKPGAFHGKEILVSITCPVNFVLQ